MFIIKLWPKIETKRTKNKLQNVTQLNHVRRLIRSPDNQIESNQEGKSIHFFISDSKSNSVV